LRKASCYKHETYKKLVEHSGESSDTVRSLIREEALQESRRRVEGLRLGGMITFVTGIGVMIFLYALADEQNVYLVGLIPALIGLVLMFYGFFLVKKPDEIQG